MSAPQHQAGQVRAPFEIEETADQRQTLDPFSFHANWTSRFTGLGGLEPAHEAAYAFHTDYVELKRGAGRFRVQFENLSGTSGTITFIIHAFDGVDHIFQHLNTSISLSELIEREGIITFEVAQVEGYKFALLAMCYGEFDGKAIAITVELVHTDPFTLAPPAIAPLALGQHSGSQILSLRSPRFAVPSSQPCTMRQFTEAAFYGATAHAGKGAEPDPSLWRHLIRERLLSHFGALREGAGMVHIGPDPDGLVTRALEAGCKVLHWGEHALEHPNPQIRKRQILADLGFFPSTFAGYFDIVVSGVEPQDMGSIAAWSRFVMDSAKCLRIGGLALYTCRLDLSLTGDVPSPHHVLSRTELERLCVKLVSQKLDLIQLRYGSMIDSDPWFRDEVGATPFVLALSRSIP